VTINQDRFATLNVKEGEQALIQPKHLHVFTQQSFPGFANIIA